MDVLCAGLDALYDRVKAHPTFRGVQVLDGDNIEALKGSFFAIGSDGESDSAGDGVRVQAGLSARSRMTQETVTCFGFAGSGDPRMKPKRDELRNWFQALQEIIAKDNTLGGAVHLAEIVSWTYSTGRGATGHGATIEIRVQFTAL